MKNEWPGSEQIYLFTQKGFCLVIHKSVTFPLQEILVQAVNNCKPISSPHKTKLFVLTLENTIIAII